MNEFKTYHPIVNFLYFIFVIGFSCVFMHPVCLGISFVCGFVYSLMLRGRETIKAGLLYMLPMIIAMAVINPAFNHEGATIIEYLPSGNPLTLESVVYGIAAAVMITCVICWFTCYNEVMTSDKFIYLTGRIIPSLSLVISMTLRFVPRFAVQFKAVINAQRCIGRDVSCGGIIQRAKRALSVLSIMTTWALENAADTADSMKSRGYGLVGRTSFSIFVFDKRDVAALLYIVFLSVYIFAGSLKGGIYFRYFPSMKSAELSHFGVSVIIAYAALCVYPIVIEVWEAVKWKFIKSKI